MVQSTSEVHHLSRANVLQSRTPSQIMTQMTTKASLTIPRMNPRVSMRGTGRLRELYMRTTGKVSLERTRMTLLASHWNAGARFQRRDHLNGISRLVSWVPAPGLRALRRVLPRNGPSIRLFAEHSRKHPQLVISPLIIPFGSYVCFCPFVGWNVVTSYSIFHSHKHRLLPPNPDCDILSQSLN